MHLDNFPLSTYHLHPNIAKKAEIRSKAWKIDIKNILLYILTMFGVLGLIRVESKNEPKLSESTQPPPNSNT